MHIFSIFFIFLYSSFLIIFVFSSSIFFLSYLFGPITYVCERESIFIFFPFYFYAFTSLSFFFPCSWIDEKDVKKKNLLQSDVLEGGDQIPTTTNAHSPTSPRNHDQQGNTDTRWRCAPGGPAWPLRATGEHCKSLGLWGFWGRFVRNPD